MEWGTKTYKIEVTNSDSLEINLDNIQEPSRTFQIFTFEDQLGHRESNRIYTHPNLVGAATNCLHFTIVRSYPHFIYISPNVDYHTELIMSWKIYPTFRNLK